MIVREVEIVDAEELTELIHEVEASSEFMLWEAGEREIDVDQQKNMIKRMKESSNSTILVAENEDGDLTGYLLVIGGNAKRNEHSAYLVIGIANGFRGQSIGTKLFAELENWAVHHHIHRLELTVVVQNEAGVALYKKMGFEIEGTKKNSLFIGNRFVDEYYMSKLLQPVIQ